MNVDEWVRVEGLSNALRQLANACYGREEALTRPGWTDIERNTATRWANAGALISDMSARHNVQLLDVDGYRRDTRRGVNR